ncbi:MAG: hypothetical protein KDD61_12290, partial [Bdellovibrionales bacterium]|nr:hypothetical protein [Bdellovibrionales bacterium]
RINKQKGRARREKEETRAVANPPQETVWLDLLEKKKKKIDESLSNLFGHFVSTKIIYQKALSLKAKAFGEIRSTL